MDSAVNKIKLVSSDLDATLLKALQKFEQLMRLGPYAIAVSGGSDSLALVYAIHKFFSDTKHHMRTVTFDHQLREDSRAEAERVAAWMQSIGIQHTILTWYGEKPKYDVMQKARDARYQSIQTWMDQEGLKYLFLGHHEDDFLETVFMRFLKKTGPDGFSPMALVRSRGSMMCVRPFLGVSKPLLQQFLKHEDRPWIDDPSNENTNYGRPAVRRLLTHETLGDFVKKNVSFFVMLGCLSKRLRSHFLNHHVRMDPMGFLTVPNATFDGLARDFQVDVIRAVVSRLGGRKYPPKRRNVYRLLEQLTHGFTLGGCYLRRYAHALIIARECQHSERVHLKAHSSLSLTWDHRFQIHAVTNHSDLTLKPLSLEGWTILQQESNRMLDLKVPFPVILSLPSLWNNGMLLEVPHLKVCLSKTKDNAIIQDVKHINPFIADEGDFDRSR